MFYLVKIELKKIFLFFYQNVNYTVLCLKSTQKANYRSVAANTYFANQ